MIKSENKKEDGELSKVDKINLLLDRLESSLIKLEKSKQSKNLENILLKANEYWENTYKLLIDLKNKAKEINSQSLIELTEIIIQCLCFQQDLLTLCFIFQKPDERGMNLIFSRFKILIKPINKLESSDPNIKLQAKCIENGLNVLCWLFNDYECDVIAKTYYESIDFTLNQIMMKKNKKEIELFKIFKNLLKTVVDFVGTYNKNGLNWQIKGNNEINDLILELGATYRNNFSPKDNNDEKELELKKMNENKNKIRIAIESGEIKSHLKPIAKKSENKISEIKEEEDDANENNQKEKIKFSCSTFFNTGTRKSYASKNDKENYEENKNIIMYENYFQLNKIIEPEKLQIGTFIKIVNCINCTFNINKRINKIMVVNCENCNISCNELISDIEIINCSKINVICEGHIDIAIVYRSKGIIFLLNSVSKSLKVRRSFSEDIVLEVIKENEGYKEYVDYRLPEQSVFRINEEKKMEIKYINY